MISRPLWATYIVTPEQKSSGILISELFEVRKWVVEKFHGISPGLDSTIFAPAGFIPINWKLRDAFCQSLFFVHLCKTKVKTFATLTFVGNVS